MTLPLEAVDGVDTKFSAFYLQDFGVIDTMCNGWNVLGEENIEIMSGMQAVCSTGQEELNHIKYVKYLFHHKYIFHQDELSYSYSTVFHLLSQEVDTDSRQEIQKLMRKL